MSSCERDKVVKMVHACLTSAKGGVPIETLSREYKSLTGTAIPYRSLGYASLDEFIDQGRDFCRVSFSAGGGVVVHAAANAASAHVAHMVSKQRATAKRKPKMPPRQPFAAARGAWQPTRGAWNSTRGPPANQRRTTLRPANTTGNSQGWSRPQSNLNSSRGPQSKPPPPLMRRTISQSGMGQNANNSNKGSQKLSDNRNYGQELRALCQDKNFGVPEYKTSAIGAKNCKFLSTVLIGDFRFKTYPAEYNSKEMAENAVSKLALESLLNKGSSSMPKSNSAPGIAEEQKNSTNQLDQRFIDRILQLVISRKNGVFSTRVAVEYKQKYKEELPVGWAHSIKESSKNSKLRIEDSAIEGTYIVFPDDSAPEIEDKNSNQVSTPSLQKQNGVEQKPSTTNGIVPIATNGEKSSDEGDKSSDEGKNSTRHGLPQISYPGDDKAYWNVYVTSVTSSACIYIRLLGDDYSTLFDELATDMEMFYFSKDDFPIVQQPIVKHLYAAKFCEEWYRVEVVSVDEIVTCFLVDLGETEVFQIDDLRELDSRFTKLPAQAVAVKLYGLEHLEDNASALTEIQNMLPCRSFVAEVHSKVGDDISVILCDTSTEKDINLNKELLDKLDLPSPKLKVSPRTTSQPLVDDVPKLTQDEIDKLTSAAELAALKELVSTNVPDLGQFLDVQIALARDPNNFIVQPWSTALILERNQENMLAYYNDKGNHFPVSDKILKQDHYFAALHTDEVWYRIRIDSVMDDDTVVATFVDYGDVAVIPIKKLQVLWVQFRNLPMQAIKASLSDIIPVSLSWTPEDSIWFGSRVINRPFVAKIKDRLFDTATNTYEIKVSLIDTSHPVEDTYVEKELVDLGKAAFLCL